MSKYIDSERLVANITRLKGQLIRGACASQIEMETNCKDEAYNEVLAIIDSLQQEHPKKSKKDCNGCPHCVVGKYIDSDKLIATLERQNDDKKIIQPMIRIITSLQQEQPEVDLNSKVTFDCISKKVTMSVQELINYYIDKECCDVADECGF